MLAADSAQMTGNWEVSLPPLFARNRLAGGVAHYRLETLWFWPTPTSIIPSGRINRLGGNHRAGFLAHPCHSRQGALTPLSQVIEY